MKDMDHISVELAARIHKLMTERTYFREQLAERESLLRVTLEDWAKEATGVRQGDVCYFKGHKVKLVFWHVEEVPFGFKNVSESIGAFIQVVPEANESVSLFKPDEFSVKDFQRLETDDNGETDDRKD